MSKSLPIVPQNSEDVSFFQISNGWYLSNFNIWHFSYFDCEFFSQCNFTFIKTSSPISWSEVGKKYFTDHYSSVNWYLRKTGEVGLQSIESRSYTMDLFAIICVEAIKICLAMFTLWTSQPGGKSLFSYPSFQCHTKIIWVEMVKVFENVHRSQITLCSVQRGGWLTTEWWTSWVDKNI